MVLETAVIIAIISLASTVALGIVGLLSKVKNSRCGAFECQRGATDATEILENVVERQEEIIENLVSTQVIPKLKEDLTIDENLDDSCHSEETHAETI